MNKKQFVVTGLAASFIAGCCTYDPSTGGGTPQPVNVEESIELVGFQPKDEKGFETWLNSSSHSPHIFRVQKYANGVPGQVFGDLKDIGCELEGKIEYWVKNPPVGKTAKTGATTYTGRLGASCSTSCPPHGSGLSQSVKLADEFRDKYGYAHRGKHHHDHD